MRIYTSTWTGKTNQMFDTEYDELVSRTMIGDLLFASAQERTEALAQIEEILLHTVPFIPIFQNTNWQVYTERVTLYSREWAPGIGFITADVEPMLITDIQ